MKLLPPNPEKELQLPRRTGLLRCQCENISVGWMALSHAYPIQKSRCPQVIGLIHVINHIASMEYKIFFRYSTDFYQVSAADWNHSACEYFLIIQDNCVSWSVQYVQLV